jgi:hypothetical protein
MLYGRVKRLENESKDILYGKATMHVTGKFQLEVAIRCVPGRKRVRLR